MRKSVTSMQPGLWVIAKRRPGRCQGDLRGHAAGPEQRQFVAAHRHCIAIVGPRQVGDADQRRIAQVHRRAMDCGKAGADLDRTDGVAAR